MGHPEVDNRTPFAFAPLLLADEEGRPLVVPVVRATFAVSPRGEVALAEEQPPIPFAGVPNGEPGKSSWRLEPEAAFVKPATDVVLLGHATAPRAGTTQLDVGFRVGPVQKIARVFGDRVWSSGLLGTKPGAPQPFERVPLLWEHAFGGWDRTAEKPEHHACEPRNPLGRGFKAKHGKLVSGALLPNIEDPKHLLGSPGAVVPPIGFGFVGCDQEPRSKLAGTFDEAWSKARSPLLPKDFDRRFFNAAPEGLIAPGHLNGDEDVVAIGVTPEGRWEFALPGAAPPTCRIALRQGPEVRATTVLDTVVVDADARTVTLTWRCHAPLRTGPHDLRRIEVECANAEALRRVGRPVPVAAGAAGARKER